MTNDLFVYKDDFVNFDQAYYSATFKASDEMFALVKVFPIKIGFLGINFWQNFIYSLQNFENNPLLENKFHLRFLLQKKRGRKRPNWLILPTTASKIDCKTDIIQNILF